MLTLSLGMYIVIVLSLPLCIYLKEEKDFVKKLQQCLLQIEKKESREKDSVDAFEELTDLDF